MWLPTRIVSYLPSGRHPEPVPFGTGLPVTVLAGGLGMSIAETRVLASGVAGTRVCYDARGHGATGVPEDGDWSYAALTRDLRGVADEVGATRAIGVSMGAAALLGVLAETPDRFERCVFHLPAILDAPRGSVPEVDVASLPPEALAGLLRALAETAPIPSRAVLRHISAPCLVIGQEGDITHPHFLARALAAALPNAELAIFPRPGIVENRRALRELVAGFLNSKGSLTEPSENLRGT